MTKRNGKNETKTKRIRKYEGNSRTNDGSQRFLSALINISRRIASRASFFFSKKKESKKKRKTISFCFIFISLHFVFFFEYHFRVLPLRPAFHEITLEFEKKKDFDKKRTE